ncbi:hypothetical protein B0F90DRAFT_1808725 [Multifurca ochricompacta]|uniref:Tyrosine--tRNA ligase n=1 Tax=Multifurca ochricompacta TaxID=376703 RepID=A0AAD4M9E1_9AGAM|nr:hypothetical protein B0F90DRAFT_1808725 [Multifurca ochricompacta]
MEMVKAARRLLYKCTPKQCASDLSRRALTTRASLLDELTTRGFVSQVTKPEQLQNFLHDQNRVVYAGIDPTADSLHVGHILPMMCLVHFQIRGHQIIPLIGGATALIGDPSGRSMERPHMEEATVNTNMLKLSASVQKFFERVRGYADKRVSSLSTSYVPPPLVMNNIDWFKNLGVLEFMRVAGIAARVSSMIARESVQSRLNSQQGISFAEFSYQLLQAYDFLALHERTGCTIQVGGSDQWGNIIAGLELIGRTSEPLDSATESRERAYGITTPLLTTASGAKFGKSAGNAIWLNDQLTTVYDFYQFFMKTPDEDVGRYLKLFTLLPLEEIEQVLEDHSRKPEERTAQKLLADEVTELVHTSEGVKRAKSITRVLFGTDVSAVNAEEVLEALTGDRRLFVIPADEMYGTTILRLTVNYGVIKNASAAKSLIAMRGLYLNGQTVDAHRAAHPDDLIDGRLIIVRAGKDKHAVFALQP